MKQRSGGAFIAVVLALSIASRVAAWEATVDGTDHQRQDGATAVAVGPSGDVFATGFTDDNNFVVVKVSGTTGNILWRQTVAAPTGPYPYGRAITVDGAGDAVVAGGGNMTLIKLSGATGAMVWSYTLSGSTDSFGLALALDGAGDVLGGGTQRNAAGGKDFVVVKLSGTTGAELWPPQRIGGLTSDVNIANVVRADPVGDVIAAGVIDDHSFDLVKLSGASGAELWRHAGGEAVAAAVDGAGDVVAVGWDFIVVKVSGTNGTEAWRHSNDFGRAVALDAMGDVFVAGDVQNATEGHSDGAVVKLSGATGTELWPVQVISGTAGLGDHVNDLAVDAVGDAIVAGQTWDVGTDFTILKFSGSTGERLWFTTIDGTEFGAQDLASAVTVDGAGTIAAAGTTVNRREMTGYDFTVARFSDRISGKKMALSGDGSTRTLSVSSRDPLILASGHGAPADPTVGGAVLELSNPTTAETAAVMLPASNWSGNTPRLFPGTQKYRYTDHGSAHSSILIQSGKRLKIRSRGPIPFSLNEPSQGSLAVKLTIGTGGFRYCMRFGGTILADLPGRFVATDTPAPDHCP